MAAEVASVKLLILPRCHGGCGSALLSCAVFRQDLCCITGWPSTTYVAKDDPELVILRFQVLLLFTDLRVLCLLGKHDAS